MSIRTTHNPEAYFINWDRPLSWHEQHDAAIEENNRAKDEKIKARLDYQQKVYDLIAELRGDKA